mgnify:CR=1 FL=1
MADITVQHLATVVGTTAEKLVEQLKDAGVKGKTISSTLSEDDKVKLLAHLRESHGKAKADITRPKKTMTLKRRKPEVTELKQTKGRGAGSVSIEVRKKKGPGRSADEIATGLSSDELLEAEKAAEAHQKLVEETPSPFMTEKLREDMGMAAIKAAESVKYEGVGTVEFLVDKHRNFYFMEMNTRIQVEHPVTEEVVDYDLIREQIKVAAGVKISGKNYDPQLHAIECRINAEDPENDFRPSPGMITNFHAPGGHGIRIDTHAYTNYMIPPFYDSMIAKLITVAQTREEAIAKMERALEEFIIEGVKTTIPFHQKLMKNEEFRKGKYTTKFMETFEM